MEFIFGFVGAVVAMSICLVCTVFGWWLREKAYEKEAPVTAEELTPEQKRAIKDQQEAWQQIHDYNVETAYGLNRQRHESEG